MEMKMIPTAKGVTDKVISVRQLKLVEEFSSNGEVVVWLRKRGYVRYDKKIAYDGTPHVVWYRPKGVNGYGITKSMINKHFRKSMEITDGN